MSFKGQLIKLGFNTDGISNALWQGAARYAVGCNVASGTAFKIGGDPRTIGIDINADCATGLKFSGGYTTTAIQIGTDASKLTLAGADDHAIDIATTCAAVTGTVQVMDIEHTHTGATYVTKIEALKVGVTSAVMTGDWVNAIYGVLTYTNPGGAEGGMAAAICAEVNLPAKNITNTGGTYTLFHGYLNVPTSCVLESTTTHVVSLLRLEAGGGNVADFNEFGFLLQLSGLTAGSTDLVSLTSQTAKVIIGSSTRYLLLSQIEDGLGLGVTGTRMSLAATGRAIDVFTTSTSLTGNLKTAVIDHTYTGTDATAHNIEVLKVQLASAQNTGAWVNAVFGRVNYSSDGRPYGSASAICGEMSWDTAGGGAGTYTVFQAELDIPTTNGSQVGAEGSIIRASLWGDGASKFDDKGYLLSLQGFTGGDTHMFDDAMSEDTSPAINATLKIRIGTTDWWIPLSDTKDCS